MRFVAVKTEDQQARAMLFRTRQMFVGQRTQMINALRGHLAEHGLVAATGTAQLKRLADAIEDRATALPEGVRDLGQMYLAQIEGLNARVAELDLKMRAAAKEADVARRFQTMPGMGPITALAIETFAPDLATFRRGRDFAAWLGLVPKQHSTGGKARLGKTSKMGQRDIRTLLVSGAPLVHVNMHCRAVDGRSAGSRTVWHPEQWLGDAPAGSKASHGRGDCTCQQNGPWPLGYDDETRRLPQPGGDDGIGALRFPFRPGASGV